MNAASMTSFRRTQLVLVALAMGFVALCPQGARADLALIMVEEHGCMWCARWHAEVGPGYPLTPEGRIAPLRPMDIHAQDLAEFDLMPAAIYTPTFVLMENGVEIGRIEGYPVDEFFWGLLGRLLDRVNPSWATVR